MLLSHPSLRLASGPSLSFISLSLSQPHSPTAPAPVSAEAGSRDLGSWQSANKKLGSSVKRCALAQVRQHNCLTVRHRPVAGIPEPTQAIIAFCQRSKPELAVSRNTLPSYQVLNDFTTSPSSTPRPPSPQSHFDRVERSTSQASQSRFPNRDKRRPRVCCRPSVCPCA